MGYQVRANQFSDRQMSDVEAAYMAGLLDGEGAIYLVARKQEGRRSHHFNPEVNIGNSNLVLLDWVVTATGNGRIMVNRLPSSSNHKQVYSWQLSPRQIRHVLPQVLPYLVGKRCQAELLLEFFDLQTQADRGPRGWHLVDPVVIQQILDLYEDLRRLNHRGLTAIEPLQFSTGVGKERKKTCDEPECESRRYYGQIYCYQHWLQRRTPAVKTCEECGASFEAILAHRRFCSDRCQWRSAARRRKEQTTS